MNGGFRIRPNGQFVANSLNVKGQQGIQEAGETNELPSKAAATSQSGSTFSLPSISLPKGGGAIRGMGEKFAANPVTGTGSLSVPIITSPGRSGFGPQLSLSYDSGSGNGPFGFGWSLSLPSITRKTDKGLPKYQDAIESDVFILSGAEDLVPVLVEKGKVIPPRIIDGKKYKIDLYRPRIEGLFARIERWTSDDGDVHWRSISKDNILTVYGRDEKSRIADKSRIFSWLICESYDDKGNAIVYKYEPENEKGIDLSQANESNRLRNANLYLKRIKYGNRNPLLLDTTVLGFRVSHIVQPDFASADWMFEVVFDYGEGHYAELDHDDDSSKHRFIQASSSAGGTWKCRHDPFSTYRAGFEVRTYRRCQRVLMFHSFPELGSEPCLVRSTEFDYSDLDYSSPVEVETELNHKGSTRFASFIRSVTQSGYVKDEKRSLTYLKKSLPPLEFDYSQAAIHEEIEEIDARSLENMPYGLDGARYQWVDLDGEGVSGILTEQAEAWFYKPNLGDGKFGAMETIATKPSLASLSGGNTQLLDLAGDGQLDVAELGGTVPGFYERTVDQKWENFIPFTSLPNISWKDPNLKFVDLTGDGHADVMITEDEVFTWYPSLAEEGFGPSEKVRQALDEETGHRLVFDDGTQSIYLADFSGDGLTDLVRIRNGEVCYWPNLGYGLFGAKVTMDNAPWFDYPDIFDQKRIRLADVDGSGMTDIIYLGHNGASIYFNRSGNSWSSARKLVSFPHIDNLSSVQVADLFGNGTACLVWSSPLPSDSGRPMLYIDLMGEYLFNWDDIPGNDNRRLIEFLKENFEIDWVETAIIEKIDNNRAIKIATQENTLLLKLSNENTEVRLKIDDGRADYFVVRTENSKLNVYREKKPHLLIGSKNNLGAETRVHYAASTKFYLKDKADGKPWITRIPFPVHVVERVETYDRISRNRFVSHYAYHHGYFDGIEREFRGFGMVEQWDTEEFAVLSGSDEFPSATNIDKASHVPPVITKTWFHTGAYLRGEEISRQLSYEYFGAPDPDSPEFQSFRKTLLDDTVLPSVAMTADETCEACRTLKGSILRQEVYADDGSPKSAIPYSVSERNYTIELLQPRESNQHAVFFTHANETINYHYERNIQDPRIQHEMVIGVDDFGNVERSVAIGYPRCDVPDRQPEQMETHITLTVNRFINSPELPIKFRARYFPENPDWYRVGVPSETQTFEIVNPPEPTVSATSISLFKFKDIRTLTEDLFPLHQNEPDTSKTLLYEMWNWSKDATTPSGQRLRLIERVRTIYRMNDLTGLLMPDQVDSLALPGESYKLAFTPGLLGDVYQRKHKDQATEKLLPNDPSGILGSNASDGGGYVDLNGDGHWWIPSGRVFYDINANDKNPAATAVAELAEACKHFFLPRKFIDPFGHRTTIDYDRQHNLLMENTEDAAGNSVHAENDYRVLQPYLVTDPNGNRSQVIFDALGMVAGAAVMGKANEPDGKPKGDLLDGFQPDLTQAQLDEFMAKPREPGANPTEGAATKIMYDLLGKATSRIIYDIDRFKRTGEPPFAATIARETHNADLKEEEPSKLQVSFSYSDGFGREIQKKIQAEPGALVEGGIKVNPRWVGSGWTVFNNKGKPVRQYEPFFDDTHKFKFGKKVGMSSILFYDPVERVVATLHPNHTYEKIVFDPWHQKTYDVNDTVAMDSRTDPDISGYVEEYFKQEAPVPEDWKTWLKQRGVDNPNTPPQELIGMAPDLKAALRTLPHADTPTVAYFDILGRPFLTIADNGKDETNKKILYETRVVLDIEGNQREVKDAQDRIVMKYDYDMLGSRIHQSSMEAGERWMLNDVTGKPIRAWDSRGFIRSMTYDSLRRPVELFVTDASGMEFIAEKTEYGESKTKPETTNHRTKSWNVYDAAGIVVSDSYDFKGNLLIGKRQLLPQPYHKDQVNWNLNPTPKETFTSSTTYDALNRPIQMIAPHRTGGKLNVIQPVYNEANLLEREDIWLGQTEEPPGLLDPGTATKQPVKKNDPLTYTGPVKNINYNAKGQREFIEYGNGVRTQYEYDPQTFRLTHLFTTRGTRFPDDCKNPIPCKDPPWDCPKTRNFPCGLQNIHYTYDPAGNITTIRDDAQQTIYFSKSIMQPESNYTYDAIYRLINAKGREHMGSAQTPWPTWDDRGRTGLEQPGNEQQMRNYVEEYFYDEVGNIDRIKHSASNGNGANPNNWIQRFTIDPDPADSTKKMSNRLTACEVGSQTGRYTYDSHGNMTSMPHLPNMAWDFKDQLQWVDKSKGSDGSTGCKVYFTYDAGGQRVRKVMEQNGKPLNERIYIGGFEIYHKYDGINTDPVLERESLHIMDDKQRIMLIETRTLPTKPDPKDPIQLIRYQFGNHLGSAGLELDPEAKIISYEEYYPYGSTSYQAVRKDIEVPIKRYRYTGKERDEETGLYYQGARYYAPWLGRWVSCDPKNNINLYLFVKNNPINLIDPNGKEDSWWDTTISGVKDANKWIKDTAGKAGEKIQDTAEEFIQQAGIKNQYITTAIRGAATFEATVVSSILEVGAGVVMTGPNILTGLDSAGTNIGEGLGRAVYGETTEEKWLGVAQLSGGIAEGALTTASVLSLAQGAQVKSRGVNREPGEAQVTANNRHGKAFEKQVTREKKSILTDSAEQVTVEPYTAKPTAQNPNPPTAKKVVLDNVERSKITGSYRLTEAKSTTTADLQPNQRIGHPLIEQNGGVVRGPNGGAAMPAGTVIPPTPVPIIRPTDLIAKKAIEGTVLPLAAKEVRPLLNQAANTSEASVSGHSTGKEIIKDPEIDEHKFYFPEFR